MTQAVNVNVEGVVLVQTDDATQGEVVEQRKIEELPLNGRNYLQLLTIGAGARRFRATKAARSRGNEARRHVLHVSGQREVSVGYLIDGVDSRATSK